jgi:hypothetical protein
MFAGNNFGRNISRSVSSAMGSRSQPNIIIYNYLDGQQMRGYMVKTLAKNLGAFR